MNEILIKCLEAASIMDCRIQLFGMYSQSFIVNFERGEQAYKFDLPYSAINNIEELLSLAIEKEPAI